MFLTEPQGTGAGDTEHNLPSLLSLPVLLAPCWPDPPGPESERPPEPGLRPRPARAWSSMNKDGKAREVARSLNKSLDPQERD